MGEPITNDAEEIAPSENARKVTTFIPLATRTEAEVRAAFEKYYSQTPTPISYVEEVDLANFTTAGQVQHVNLQEALNLVNLIRYVAGLPDDIVMDDAYNQYAQYGSALLRYIGHLDHKPAQPDGMPKDFYDKGYRGTSQSNIAGGFRNIFASIVSGYMNDGDSSNISTVGHRRWILNPTMSQIGFGYCNGYTATYVFDTTRERPTEYMPWPAAITPYLLWSGPLSLGISGNKVTNPVVTVNSQKENKTYTFSDGISDGVFYNNFAGYGDLRNCLIFGKNGNEKFAADDQLSIHVTYTQDSQDKTMDYTVRFLKMFPLTKIELSKNELTVKMGNTSKIAVASYTPDNTDDSRQVVWTSSDVSVATVDDSGKILALKPGSTIITATGANAISATCNVTVTLPSVKSVSLNKEKISLIAGESETLIATITPENVDDPTLKWASNRQGVAAVDANGKVTARRAGTATITARSSNGKSATCVVTVTAKVVDVTGVTLNKTSLPLTEGDSDTLTATVAPENAADKTVTWTSDKKDIATVDTNGKVTAVKAGTANITATASNGKSATCAVTVTAKVVDVTGVTLNKTALSLIVGDSETLTATVAPANATNKTVTWKSSNAAIAAVADGKVTAVKAGTATITATTKNGKSATCAVTVTAKKPDVVAATGVTLNKTKLPLTEGDSETLTATVAPANATNKTVTWASNNATVATVANGKVTAVKAGTATITATTKNGKSATCAVTVTAKKPDVVAATGVTLNKTKLPLTEGDSETLTATVAPENATNKTVTWKSNNATVATVANGKVTAVKAGTATITATTKNGKSAACNVTVTAKKPDVVDVTGITLNETAFSLIVGENKTVTATVLPADATDKTVTWTSSNAAAASVENGKVTALKVGKTTITATANGKTATCEVLVKAVPEAGVAGFVERLYTEVLGRASDADGKATWIHQLQSKANTGAQAAQGFVMSAELKSRGLSNEEFLKVMYRTFFNRDPDNGGFTIWMNNLNNGISREFVLCGFANSAEFTTVCNQFGIERGTITSTQPRDKSSNLTAFVNRLYTKLLDRQGEEDGLNTWTNQILRGAQTPQQVAHGFVFSKEFEGKKLNNEKFVEYMYRTFMGREYDAAGKATWVKYLQQGKTREYVFNGFADSVEFANIIKGFGL